ncbi:MAG: sodium:proton antiporter [Rhodospirillales bacterium]|nr:sodium:proton antiporter [Rhodospirillales bacterium]
MSVFEIILVMLAVAVFLLAVARQVKLPYPVLLAIAGAALAVAPVDLGLHLDPQFALALFIAPVLLDAAYDTSLRDLKRHWAPVASLVLIAVGLTTIATAFVVHTLVPTVPWAAAIAIGAIVAPPDAVAATTVLRDVRLPHRISVILEGEALLNDASALLIYRLAVAAVLAGGTLGTEAIAPAFLLSLFGSVIAGWALAWAIGRVTRQIADAPSSIIVQFVSTYGVWVIAERCGLSPILTMVTYAMTLARSTPGYLPARLRLPSYAVWETAVLVLNVLAFLVIGLELGPIIAAAEPGELRRWFGVGAAILATVIMVRLLWTMTAALWTHRRIIRGGAAAPGGGPLPGWRTGLVIGWAGTRGLVTVATALALPHDFPERGMLLFAAFTVTFGTLLIQGLTLRPLVLALRMGDDATVDREVRAARIATAEAALDALRGESGREFEMLQAELDTERRIAAAAGQGDGRPTLPEKALRAKVLAERRKTLLAMRNGGVIGDEAFHRLEEELDLADLAVATRT